MKKWRIWWTSKRTTKIDSWRRINDERDTSNEYDGTNENDEHEQDQKWNWWKWRTLTI